MTRGAPPERGGSGDPGGSGQGGLEGDGGAGEGLAHRAADLGLVGHAQEVGLVDAGHGADDGEVDAGDALAGLEGDGGRDGELLGGVVGLGQGVGERHRVAARVGRGDELLGAGAAVGLLGARRPVDVERAEAGRLERHLPRALEQAAGPVRGGVASGGHGWFLLEDGSSVSPAILARSGRWCSARRLVQENGRTPASASAAHANPMSSTAWGVSRQSR